jgi:hypothetical protein
MSWNTRDIGYFYHMANSPRGRLDFSAVYIHHYFAKIKADLAT